MDHRNRVTCPHCTISFVNVIWLNAHVNEMHAGYAVWERRALTVPPSFLQVINMISDIHVYTPKAEAMVDYADDLEDNFIAHYFDQTYPGYLDQAEADGSERPQRPARGDGSPSI